MSQNKYKVLIVGAGRIGALFDNPGSENILTHANAFCKDERFELLDFVDVDLVKANYAAQRWRCHAFKDIKEAFSRYEIDVVVVAVCDDYHYEVLKELVYFSVKLVFAEKPLTRTLKEAAEIVSLYKEKQIPIIVNYSRRFIPEFEILKKEIRDGLYGCYITGFGCYGKGILHNGSHMLDLLRYLIGDIKGFKVESSVFDYYKDDPTVSAILKFNNKSKFFLQEVDCSLFTIFELDLLFEKKRIRIIDSGFKIETYDVKASPIFNGYKNLIKTNEFNTKLNRAMYYAVENIGDYLVNKEKIKCTSHDAYNVMKVCLQIRDSALR